MVFINHPKHGELKCNFSISNPQICVLVYISLISLHGMESPFHPYFRLVSNIWKNKVKFVFNIQGSLNEYIESNVDASEVLLLGLRFEADGGKLKNFPILASVLENGTPRLLAGLVLKFFSDLPEPIFPFITHQELDAISLRQQEDIRLGLITKTIKNLPSEHFFILSKLIEHLYSFWGGQEPFGKDLNTISAIIGRVIIRKDDLALGATPTGMSNASNTEMIITRDLIINYPLMFGSFFKG